MRFETDSIWERGSKKIKFLADQALEVAMKTVSDSDENLTYFSRQESKIKNKSKKETNLKNKNHINAYNSDENALKCSTSKSFDRSL